MLPAHLGLCRWEGGGSLVILLSIAVPFSFLFRFCFVCSGLGFSVHFLCLFCIFVCSTFCFFLRFFLSASASVFFCID